MSVAVYNWVKRDTQGPNPAPRQGHAITLVGKTAYIFGGSSGCGYGERQNGLDSEPVYLNDLFSLKVGLQVIWERVRQLGDAPCARDGHSLSAVGSVLYLLGGSNNPAAEECLDGLYAYDIGTLSWERCPTQGWQPRALGHSTAVVGDTLYVFGGIYKGEAKNTLYMLNTGNLTWTPLKTSGQPPSPRCDHACTVMGEKFFIMGGSGGVNTWLNDLYCFDTVTLLWSCVNVQGHLPYPRSLHTITAHHSKDIYLFGGANDSAKGKSPFGDVCKLNLSKMKWKIPSCTGVAAERRLGHTAVIIYGQLVIFGGMNDHRDFSDVCILQTRTAIKHFPQQSTGSAHAPYEENPKTVLNSSCVTPGPQTSYDTEIPIPCKYNSFRPDSATPVKPDSFDELRKSFKKRIDDVFDDLAAKYAELETKREEVSKATESFHEERNSHIEQYEKQQKELETMLQRHKEENEEWIKSKREEIDEERKNLAEERERLKKERDELREQKEQFFSQKKQLEAIDKIGAIITEVKATEN